MRAGRITAAALLAGSALAVAAPPALALAPAPALSATPRSGPGLTSFPAPAGPVMSPATGGPAASPSPAAFAEPAAPAPAAPDVNGDSITAPGEFGGLVTSFGFSVSPATVGPGGTVTLRATGCATQATASAPALLDDVPLGKGDGPGQSARVTLRADATPGTRYDVAFTCGTEQGSTPLTIRAGTTTTTPSASRHAVQNALGSSSGPGTAAITVGAVLVAVAGALVLHRLRAPRH